MPALRLLSLPITMLRILLTSTCLLATLAAGAVAADPPRFADDIAPILMNQCLACHNGTKAEGGYRVDTYVQALKEGDSGAAPLVGGQPDESELLRRIASDDEFERMPLEGEPLPKEQVETIRAWIAAGAPCDEPLRDRPLATVVPARRYPAAPEVYRQALPVTALAFSADGEQLYVSGYHEVTVWNVADGKLAGRLGNLGQRVYGLAVAPTGDRLAVACGQPGRYGEARLIELGSGALLGSFAGSGDVVFDARFDPAGERLAVAAAEGSVRIYRLADGHLQHTITSHSDWVTAVAWSEDGQRVASASRDGTAKVFAADDGRSLITYSGHRGEVRGVAFHRDGNRVYSAGDDGKLHRWKVSDGKRDKEESLGGGAFALAATDELLLAATSAKQVQLLNRDSADKRRELPGHADWVLSAAGHTASGRAAAGGFDGRVIVWDTESGDKLVEFLALPGYVP